MSSEEADLLADLTEPQREAVTHVEGPLLVLAGAGSGKTRVITRRAAYLIARAGAARRVLAVTFTNKAAEEMRERLAALGVEEALTACTFHSLCARLLRIHHERAGLSAQFTIYDQNDRLQVVSAAIEECGLSETNYPAGSAEERISRAKNAMITADQAVATASDWSDKGYASIYAAYEMLLARNQALDFDDLLLRMALLLGSDEELRAQLERRYRYVLIDEYQDTNATQYELARLLTRDHCNLCATGDPDQSIYRWRGADIGNILRFERQYPNARVVRLEQNYRSTKRILAVADALISRNVERKAKELWTHNPEGSAVRVVELSDAQAEGKWLAGDILRQVKAGRTLSDMAVFYRTNAVARMLEQAFLERGVRYQVARGVAFYGRAEIKDLLAYVRVVVNPLDEVALLRIINTPTRGLGLTTVGRLRAAAESENRRLIDVVMDGGKHAGLGAAASTRLGVFSDLLRNLRSLAELSPGECLRQVFMESGLHASLTGETSSEENAMANVQLLIDTAEEFERRYPEASVLDWLSHTSLLGDADSLEDGQGSVTLMTLHAAKGLEFPVVYIVGMEEGLIPFIRFDDRNTRLSAGEMEEERRLCFVGMTRAREELVLTLVHYRGFRGQNLRTVASPFLDELPKDHVEWFRLVPEHSRSAQGPDSRVRLPKDIDHWETGALLEHPVHGIGRLESLYRECGNVMVRVRFKDGEDRTFSVGHAELRRVDFNEVE